MYEINLDFDPTTVGFDSREIRKNDDNTYTVSRRFVHVVNRKSSWGDYAEYEAYCPCLTDDVEILFYQISDYKGRMTYGVSHWTNGGERQNDVESRHMSNAFSRRMCPLGKGEFNCLFDTHIDDYEQEQIASRCVSFVHNHPNNINNLAKDYYEKHHIVFGKSAPSSPQEDPFLPDKFKRMIIDTYMEHELE